MPRRLALTLLLLLVLSGAAWASRDEPLDALIARADAAKPQDQGRLYAEVARRQVEEADRYYTQGDAEKGKAAVQQVLAFAEKAAESARRTGKNLKKTEILLRETTRRLDDVRKTLNFEDRPGVEAAVNRLEKIRTDLLNQMFGLQEPKEKK